MRSCGRYPGAFRLLPQSRQSLSLSLSYATHPHCTVTRTTHLTILLIGKTFTTESDQINTLNPLEHEHHTRVGADAPLKDTAQETTPIGGGERPDPSEIECVQHITTGRRLVIL